MTLSPRVLELLEWPSVTEKLISYIKTPRGAEYVRNMKVLDEGSIKKQMEKISSLKELTEKKEVLDFSGMEDIEEFLLRADRESVLDLGELSMVRSSLLCSGKIRSFLKERQEEFPRLEEEYNRLHPLKDISSLLTESITEKSELNRKKYPELRKIEDEIFSCKKDAEKLLRKLMGNYSKGKALQENIFTTRNQRYVLMVKTGLKHQVRGNVNDMSASGATTYIEPDEVRELNNRIISLELEYREVVYWILHQLTQSVAAHSGEIRNNIKVITYLDFLTASARLSIVIRGNEPEITGKPVLRLKDARHPLLSMMNPGEVVANDIEIGGDFSSLIISGANTGGKTVLLKTIGLAVVMTLFGLHISADSSSTSGIFGKILADIGDDQNLNQSLSTFSGQIVELSNMLNEADEKTLVLIDEIIAGTNPGQGAALARAFIEELADTGCRIAVTTHYSELKEIATVDSRFINGSVSFDLDTYRPTYRYIPGIPGISYAVEIAGDYGLPRRVISRARELLDQREQSTEGILEDLQRIRQEHEEERLKIQEEKKRLEAEREKLSQRETRLKLRTDELKLERGLEFLDELGDFRKKVSGRISELQQGGIKDAGEIQKEIIELQEKVSDTIEDISRNKHRAAFRPLEKERALAGMKVFVPSLEKTGTIESIDASGETARVHLGGSVKSRFRISDLLVDPAAGEKNKNRKKPGRTVKKPETGTEKVSSLIQTSYNTIDLRGKTVDEALLAMESGFDSMIRDGIDSAIVIHGHGTGALKEAVRSNLRNSLYAEDFRPGKHGEGSDGVTVVRLRV
jgi:DNA mismatch repair protein MutS2